MTSTTLLDPRPAVPDGVEEAVPPQRPTRYRWVICALLFFATTVN